MRILIAEDEQAIWKPYKIVLENRGHKVIIAEDGEECLKKYKARIKSQNDKSKNSFDIDSKNTKQKNLQLSNIQMPFDAVILDYRMPKKNGLEVAKEIFDIYPTQRIIFASAYVKETLEQAVKQLKQVVELLQKPFDPDTMADQLEDVEIYNGLRTLLHNIKEFDIDNPSQKQIHNLFESVKKIQKGRTF